MMLMSSRFFSVLVMTAFLVGCAAAARLQLNDLYGAPQPVDRIVDQSNTALNDDEASDVSTSSLAMSPRLEPEFYQDVKPIVDSRCVVCHGCYDAPCQFKMTSFEAIDRGAHKEKVYNGTRLLEASLSHLSVGINTTEQWRKEGFYPVLNERVQTSEANAQASVLHRMLQLKQTHPLPEGELLPKSFDLSLDRNQECTKVEEFDRFAKKRPLWGMPYGLPAIESDKQQVLERWIESGAKALSPDLIFSEENSERISRWEQFFNGTSLKRQLMSRYIYEHLFLANLYFSESSSDVGEARTFYKLVRSKTPSGSPVEEIVSRRPFDDPGGEFYYRLQRVKSTIVAKQHMPYALNENRFNRWNELFLEADYEVTNLPSYTPHIAANPFDAFKELPVNARYRFMLDEARFTIMGFIRGPVCRGQVALNVINDHFWVLFVDPEIEVKYATGDFLAKEANDLVLPAEKGSTALLPISSWLKYSKMERKFLNAKKARFDEIFSAEKNLNLSMLWGGEGENKNAALTVYRHFDSSSVIKGLSGKTPKTAWVIDYSLLERIHYLLVAGFDVYGNAGHQLLTRLYMDFLRMEGEYAFLNLLPNDVAQQQLSFWYRDELSQVEYYLEQLHHREYETSGITFATDNPKKELFDQFRQLVGDSVVEPDVINGVGRREGVKPYQKSLQSLSDVHGLPLQYLPEQSLIRLTLSNGDQPLVSLVLNRAHTNVSHLYREELRLRPQEYTLSVIENVVGTYPNAFFDVSEHNLDDFIDKVSRLKSEADYAALMSSFGVRRTDEKFWSFSDSIHANYMSRYPIDAGYLDYNRLQNR